MNTLGYVSILTSAKDKRVKELYTTALTKKHISEIYGIRRDWWHHITQDLTAEQIEVFLRFIRLYPIMPEAMQIWSRPICSFIN